MHRAHFPSHKLKAGASALGGAPVLSIDFRVARQLQTQWCWAAVSSSVSAYYPGGPSWSQCAVASAELGGPCCQAGGSFQCNQPWYLENALTRVDHLACAFPAAVASSDVADELNHNRPVALRVGWSGGGGHFLAIRGIQPGGQDDILYLTDPIYGESLIQRTALLGGGYQGSGSWTHSYLVSN